MSRSRSAADRLREQPLYRLAAAASVAGGIVAGYRLIALRHRYGLGVPDREAAIHRLHERGAQRVFNGAVRLQGLMIKFGQTIGSNPAAVPMEYISVLSRLQDAVPPRPWREIAPALRREFGRPLTELFSEFDRTPVGAASLAQVYRARLHDGRPVAVKVLYPGIHRLVRSDLRVLKFLLWLDSRFGGYPLEPVYQELATNVPLEVDLLHEARAMEAMSQQFRADPRIVIPAVVWELSTPRLLVMDWIDGVKVTDVAGMRRAAIDAQQMADLLTDCYCRQVLVHGFFHADPHPGNLFALPGNRLAIVDFGLTKRLAPDFTRSLAALTRAMFTADEPRMIEAFTALGFSASRADDTDVLLATGAFFRGITDPSVYRAGADTMQTANEQWSRAIKANPFIAIPGEMTLVSRVFSLLTGVGVGMGAEPRVLAYVLKYTVAPPAPAIDVAALA